MEIVSVPLSRLHEPSVGAREMIGLEGIEELAESIRSVGLLNPLQVRPLGDDYEVVAGHRRLLALRLLRWPAADCVVRDVPVVDLELVKIHENLQRADLSPVEEARAVARLREEYGWTQHQIAIGVHRSLRWVQFRLDLLVLPPGLLEAVEGHHLPMSTAFILAEVDDPGELERLTGFAVRDGVTAEVARLWVQDYKRAGPPPPVTEGGAVEAVRVPPLVDPLLSCWFCRDRVGLSTLEVVRVCPGCLAARESDFPTYGTG